MSFTVKSNFWSSFKIGDNVFHNLEVLALLYRLYACASQAEKRLLRKPVIILLGSITEAILHDLHRRFQLNHIEVAREYPNHAAAFDRARKADDFGKYIAVAETHNFFAAKPSFYEKLRVVRKLRNRVHIQNRWQDFESDESRVFTADRLKLAEYVLEAVAKRASLRLPRRAVLGRTKYVPDLEFPWNPHLPDNP
jgi:hypothetical protein